MTNERLKDHLEQKIVKPVDIEVRLANYVIDTLAMYLVLFLFGVMITAMGHDVIHYFKDNFFYYRLIYSIFYFVFMFLQELATKGRSVGKYITGTKVVSMKGFQPTTKQYFIRSISRIVPFELFSYLGTPRGWHDQWSDTAVVNVRK